MPEINIHNMLPEGALLEGRYRIERYLSSGGCGNTYLAKDTKFRGSKSRVVVKEFFLNGITHRDPNTSRVIISNAENVDTYQKLRRKFRDEADRINALQHPNIVRVSDVFDANDTSYYVMDYIQGGSLAGVAGSLSEAQAVKYVRQVLGALDVVHAEGLYHLDIKPGNVMLDQYDNAILIDFGASKMLGGKEGNTLSSTILYTKGYAPSEQMYRDLELIGPWTDLYAVGATLFNLISGRTPPSPSVPLAKKHEALQMPGAGPAVQQFVWRCMQNDVTARPQSVQEALSLLNSPLRSAVQSPTPQKPVANKVQAPKPPVALPPRKPQAVRSPQPPIDTDPTDFSHLAGKDSQNQQKPSTTSRSLLYISLTALLGIVLLVSGIWAYRSCDSSTTYSLNTPETDSAVQADTLVEVPTDEPTAASSEEQPAPSSAGQSPAQRQTSPAASLSNSRQSSQTTTRPTTAPRTNTNSNNSGRNTSTSSTYTSRPSAATRSNNPTTSSTSTSSSTPQRQSSTTTTSSSSRGTFGTLGGSSSNGTSQSSAPATSSSSSRTGTFGTLGGK